MLNKSKKNAVILSCTIVFSFALSSALVNLLLPYLLTGNLRVIIENPENLNTPADYLSLVVLLVVVLGGLIAIGAYWLYKFFGEAYYGNKGILRWALFGVLFALLIKTPDWFLGERLPIIKNLLEFLSLFAAFFLARWIVPIQRKPAAKTNKTD